MTKETGNHKVTEKVIYEDGKFIVDVSSFVKDRVKGNGCEEIIMTTRISNANEGLEKDLVKLHKEYVGRCPIEEGCYPTVEREGKLKTGYIRPKDFAFNGLIGHLHFDPAYNNDGILLKNIIHRIEQLIERHSGDYCSIRLTLNQPLGNP